MTKRHEINCPHCAESKYWDDDCACKGTGRLWIEDIKPLSNVAQATHEVLKLIQDHAIKDLAVPDISQLAHIFELPYADISTALFDLDRTDKIHIDICGEKVRFFCFELNKHTAWNPPTEEIITAKRTGPIAVIPCMTCRLKFLSPDSINTRICDPCKREQGIYADHLMNTASTFSGHIQPRRSL